MGRSRASAKQAGSRFERTTADYLKQHLSRFIDRKVKTGAADQGDIANVETHNGGGIAVECKDYGGKLLPAQWVAEAHTEAGHSGAVAGVVVAKRRGTTDPGEQWVLCTIDDFIAIVTGRPVEKEPK